MNRKYSNGQRSIARFASAAMLVWGASVLCCWTQALPAGVSQADVVAPQPGLPTISGPYILQPGDDLEIKAYNNPELSQSVKVRPDGNISLLLLDDVPAAGITPAKLGENLSQAYSQYFRNPKLTVIVRSFSNLNVYVGGEVVNPRLLPLTGKITVSQAVLAAGGFKSTAKLQDV